MTRQQDMVHALVAGTLKLCPLCYEPRDQWKNLKRHVAEKHDTTLYVPNQD